MKVIPFLIGLSIIVAIQFGIALLIERFVIRPKPGQTRIFLASFMALPVVAAIWLLFYSFAAPLGWKVAVSVSVFGGLVSLLPATLRWRTVRRRAAKTSAQSADIFQ